MLKQYKVDLDKLLRQFDDAVFAEDSGMENAQLDRETVRLYEEAERNGQHFTITRARLIEFQLDHVRLAVNDFDYFVCLVQRNYLSGRCLSLNIFFHGIFLQTVVY